LTEKKKKKKKRASNGFLILFRLLSLLVLFAIIFIIASIGLVVYFNHPVNSSSDVYLSENDAIRQDEDGSFLFDVRRGETSQSVGLRLERTGLITNRNIWNLLCRFDKEHIKTGTYRIVMPASMLSIRSLLVSGREVLQSVTIPEGVTIKKAARILEEAGICPSEEFILASKDKDIIRDYILPGAQSMEGYLFPDTYFFPKSYPASLVVRKMADNFFHRLESISPDFHKLSMRELNDKVILASIIEREYRIADEAPLMAGVFLNRLRINMGLQSCATVEYIITEILGRPHPKVLLFEDLEIRNPFNTYLYRGLPPAPISAPGVVALRAVMYPEKTDFLYFRLVDVSSGRHYFSRTLDEHIRAGALYTKPSWP